MFDEALEVNKLAGKLDDVKKMLEAEFEFNKLVGRFESVK
jgi:hypothetical protein